MRMHCARANRELFTQAYQNVEGGSFPFLGTPENSLPAEDTGSQINICMSAEPWWHPILRKKTVCAGW